MEEAKAKYKAAEKRGATQDELKQIASEQQIILVRRETSPDDIAGMEVSLGILTSRGGMTSHAAVVGRGMGKTVVVGANISIEEEHQQFIGLNGVVVKNGDWFSLNGSTGEIISGRLPTIPSIVIRGIDQARELN